MNNDTPDTPPSELDPPPTPRNEEEVDGVAMNMEPTDQPPIDTPVSEPPQPDMSLFERQPSPPDEPSAFEPPSVDFSQPVTASFTYDEPVESLARPEPVSADIDQGNKKQRGRVGLVLGGSVMAGVLGATLTVGALAFFGTFDTVETTTPTTIVVTGEQAVQPISVDVPQIITNLGSAVNPTAVALKAVPSVVSINVYDRDADGVLNGVGSGSGVIISADGYLVTNHHVIENADTFFVTFQDGREYEAILVGSDELTDLAVLRISAVDLVPADFGSTDMLRVGDPTVAIGNPLGQEGGASVSVGIVSAFNRTVEFGQEDRLHGMLQTDAAINSGSSGGGLFDAEGKLIGITSAIGVSQAGPEGIGYAVPVELVARITNEIIETGDVEHPFLGVSIGTYLTTADDGAIVPAGADIDSISGTDSAAALAGLRVGDIVIGIGDKTITDQTDLILAVRLYRVGDEVDFIVDRDGEKLTITVVMGRRPASEQG